MAALPTTTLPIATSTQTMQATITHVRRLIFDHFEAIGLEPEAIQRIADCIDIGTEGGNLLRGRTVIDTARVIRGHDLSPAEAEDVGKLGCLVELMNAAFVIWDDIMDGSTTRRGKPCWYRRESVGMRAVNDGCVLKASIYLILKSGFRNHPAYLNLVELFEDACLHTELGQHCDAVAATKSLEKLNWKQYEFITAKKTAYYSMYLPLAIPMLYLGLGTPERLKELYDISMKVGFIFQARDDFLDVYGDPKVTGKIGTDIQDHKCAWPVLTAMSLCDDKQKLILMENYGKDNPASVSKVKAIFDEINLPKAFKEWDAGRVAEMTLMIENATDSVVKDSMMCLLSKYFKDPRRHIPPN
ncbi:hypothetical protein N7493_011092 [Penicillium malachiteum]|uniref:Farnesyl diphosphate synthase n=1 Tax=Penicillium malachiteum TaxID=1324776 RepID=A0AAD6MQT6_9EURO|nr:hypothetical protein N7493_011092 [Penicillium malachiteum]